MWKRWSVKASASEGHKVKDKVHPSSPSVAVSPDQSPSTNKEKDGGAHVATQEPTQALVVPQPSKEEMNENDTPTPVSSIPVAQNSAVKPPTTPVDSNAVSITRLVDTLPITSSSHAKQSEPAASPPLTSSPEGKPRDTTSLTDGNATNGPISAKILAAPQPQKSSSQARRLSFPSLAFFSGHDKEIPLTSPSPSSPTLKVRGAQSIKSTPRSLPKSKLSRSEKKAFSSAVTLRTLMIGPSSFISSTEYPPPQTKDTKPHQPNLTTTPPSSNLKKVKAQLLVPKSANAIIAQLHRLPLPVGPLPRVPGTVRPESLVAHQVVGDVPIHAVCLDCTDEEADQKHFSHLQHNPTPSPLLPETLPSASSADVPGIGGASVESLIPILRDLHLVSLIDSPDFGFGQPVSEDDTGLLTGSVPSAGTIIDGFEEITKQLMMLGFATSKAVFPSHVGIYPPEDRMSMLTYWWGFELVLPKPSIIYLGKAKSISNTLLNFLSALALINSGVREVLPFVRYIANFVDFEWSAIKGQDKGKGVVCAATWVMPAAMVPRPWDFPIRPAKPPGSQNLPTNHATTKTSTGKDLSPDESSAQLPQEPTEIPEPPAPTIPMLPRVTVTPPTLPRHPPAPQDVHA